MPKKNHTYKCHNECLAPATHMIPHFYAAVHKKTTKYLCASCAEKFNNMPGPRKAVEIGK